MIRVKIGKGAYKARQDSANTSRVIVEQVTLAFTEKMFENARKVFRAAISRDVRGELMHIQALYRRFIIGAAGSRNKPRGTLDTISKGSGAPRADLAGLLPTWTPRGAEYLEEKRFRTGSIAWFDNSMGSRTWYSSRGYLRDIFNPEAAGASRTGGGGSFTDFGTQTMFEDMFGPISVEVLRNRRGSGVGAPRLQTKASKRLRVQLATIRVRALGSINNNMLNAFAGYNEGLMQLVDRYDGQLRYRLGGRRDKYRPTLEPFLKFYLQKSIPQAISARLERGNLTAFLLKN